MADTEGDPGWNGPFTRFLTYFGDLEALINITRSGASRVQMMPELERILRDESELSEEQRASRERNQKLADLAENEVQRGFPLLYAHSTVSAWGALEVLVNDLAVAWLTDHPEALTQSPLSAVKLPVGVVHGLSPQDLLQHIVIEASRSLKSDLKVGAGQFESLLAAVGLGAGVDSETRRGIYLLQQFRHLIVHRAGVADRQFVENCNDLGYEVGDQVTVSERLWTGFWVATQLYVLQLRNRARVLDGYPAREADAPPSLGELLDCARKPAGPLTCKLRLSLMHPPASVLVTGAGDGQTVWPFNELPTFSTGTGSAPALT